MTKIKLPILTACAVLFGLQMARALDLPPEIKEYLQSQHLLDETDAPLPYLNATQTGSGNVFAQYIISNWSEILDNLSVIAPEPRQQQLVIRAIESLPGKAYLDALNKLCDLEAKGVISSKTLQFAIDGRFPKNGFFSNNYQDPQVIRLVKRLQSLFPKDSKTQGLLADILSGKQRAIDQDRAGVEGTPPPASLSAQ